MAVKLLKRWLPVLVLLAIAWALKSKLPFLRNGLTVAAQAHPTWIALGIIGAFAAFAAMAAVMVVLLRAGGVKVPLRKALNLVLAANAWSATMPGGQAFAALFSFNTMTSWGATKLLATWQIVVSGAISTVWLVGLALTAMFLAGADGNLTTLTITGTGMVLLSAALYWAMRHPHQVANLITPVLKRIGKEPQEFLATANEVAAIKLTPTQFAAAATCSLLNWLLDIAVLYCSIHAVIAATTTTVISTTNTTTTTATTTAISLAGVAIAFVTAKIAGTIQTTPGGLGPVEAALTATLLTGGLPAATAVAATIIYRLITLFLTTTAGWLVWFINFKK